MTTVAGPRLTDLERAIAGAYGRGADVAAIPRQVPAATTADVQRVVGGLLRFNRLYAREVARGGHLLTSAVPLPPDAPVKPAETMPAFIPAEITDASPTDPPAEQHDEPAPPADRPADPTTEPVAQLLASHRVWWCPYCLNGRELPRPCCKTPLIRARLYVQRDDEDPLTADDYAEFFPERGDDGQPRKDDDDG